MAAVPPAAPTELCPSPGRWWDVGKLWLGREERPKSDGEADGCSPGLARAGTPEPQDPEEPLRGAELLTRDRWWTGVTGSAGPRAAEPLCPQQPLPGALGSDRFFVSFFMFYVMYLKSYLNKNGFQKHLLGGLSCILEPKCFAFCKW